MKAIVVIDQRGIPKGVLLSYALSQEELRAVTAEAEMQKHTLHYIDVLHDGEACPFHVMIDKVFSCTQKKDNP
jgi:hypothetical protein